jgi:hypothetical protein
MSRFLLSTRAAAPAALILAAFTLPAWAAPILPGYWESTDKVTSPIQDSKTSRKCITAAQIESYLSGPVNNHYSCHYTSRKIEGGTFSMAGDCVDSSGLPAKVQLSGVYTDTSFTVNGRIRLMVGGLPIPVSASTEAHRLSAECPIPGGPAPATPAPETPAPAAAPPPSQEPASSQAQPLPPSP